MEDNKKFDQDGENKNPGEQMKKKSALHWNRQKNEKKEIGGGRKKRKIKVAVAVVLVVAVAAGTVFTFRSKGKKAQVSGSRVMESKVQKGNLSQTVEGTGTLANADSTELKIPVGLKIKKIKVSEGDEVKKGDILATVDKTSLLAALAETQEEIDDVNKQLGDESDSDTSKYVEASVDGRVKKIYASKNTEAADTVLEKGALMLISLDGKMAVKMDTSVSLTVGQEVKVVLSGGSSVTGTVTKTDDESCTITVTDKGTKYNDKVTAYTSSGTKIGTGKLYINKEAKVTATSGTVSSILVSENEYVSEGDNLIKLKGDFYSEEYLSLESEKEDLEEKLEALLKIAKNNTITADSAGIITSVNISEDTESGSTSESGSSGSSVSSSGSGSSTNSSNTATATGTAAIKTTDTTTGTAAIKTTDMVTGTAAIKNSNAIKAVSLSAKANVTTQNASEITTREKNEAGTTVSSLTNETIESTGSSDSQTNTSQNDDNTTSSSQSESSTADRSQTENSGTDNNQNDNNNDTTNSSTASDSENTATKNTTENKTSDGSSSGTNNKNAGNSGNASGDSGTAKGKSGSGGMSGFSGGMSGGSSGAIAGSTSGGSASSETASGNTSSTNSDTSTDTNTELTSAFGIAAEDEMTLSVNIDEMDILSVKTGQKAVITFDAIENKEYEGEITSIDKNGTTSNGTTKYPVEITVTKEDSMLSGMNASVTITTSEVSDALLIPAAAVTEEGNTSYVYTKKDSKSGELSGKTEVQTGDTDGTNIVITSGLSEGDTVYYSMTAGDSAGENSGNTDNQDKQNMKMDGNFGGGRGSNDGGTPPSGGGPGGNN